MNLLSSVQNSLNSKMKEFPYESVTVFSVLHYVQRGNLLEGHHSC